MKQSMRISLLVIAGVMLGLLVGVPANQELEQAKAAASPEENVYLPLLAFNTYTCIDRPLVLWPYDGMTIDTLIPVYYWDTCNLPGAIETNLEISPNPDMSKSVLNLYSRPSGYDAYQLYENLSPDTTYYWRIRARYSNDDYGPYSSGSFRTPTSGVKLPPPTLISPPDNSTLPGTSVTFKWQAVPGAEKYQLVMHWSYPSGSSTSFILVYGTEYIYPYLEANKKTTWSVASVNQYAIGQASQNWTFTSGAALQGGVDWDGLASEIASGRGIP